MAQLEEGERYRDYANGYVFQVLSLTTWDVTYKKLSSGQVDTVPKSDIERYLGSVIKHI